MVSGFQEITCLFRGAGLRARRCFFSYQDCVATRLQGDGSYPSRERQRVVHRPPLAGGDAWS